MGEDFAANARDIAEALKPEEPADSLTPDVLKRIYEALEREVRGRLVYEAFDTYTDDEYNEAVGDLMRESRWARKTLHRHLKPLGVKDLRLLRPAPRAVDLLVRSSPG